MATKYHNVKGTVSWCMVYDPDEYAGDKRWKTNFYPLDEDEWEKVIDSGMTLEHKTDSDGKKFILLRRPFKRLYGDDLTFFAPPSITGEVRVFYRDANDPEGPKITSYVKGSGVNLEMVGNRTNIGNGSTVIANIAVYDTQKGKGHRWESLNVLDLIHYDSETKIEKQEEKKVVEKEEESAEEPKVKKSKKDIDAAW